LSEGERLRLLKIMEEIMASPPSRSQGEVEREIAEIRELRRLGGRRHRVD
jgi:hypothetical protein